MSARQGGLCWDLTAAGPVLGERSGERSARLAAAELQTPVRPREKEPPVAVAISKRSTIDRRSVTAARRRSPTDREDTRAPVATVVAARANRSVAPERGRKEQNLRVLPRACTSAATQTEYLDLAQLREVDAKFLMTGLIEGSFHRGITPLSAKCSVADSLDPRNWATLSKLSMSTGSLRPQQQENNVDREPSPTTTRGNAASRSRCNSASRSRRNRRNTCPPIFLAGGKAFGMFECSMSVSSPVCVVEGQELQTEAGKHGPDLFAELAKLKAERQRLRAFCAEVASCRIASGESREALLERLGDTPTEDLVAEAEACFAELRTALPKRRRHVAKACGAGATTEDRRASSETREGDVGLAEPCEALEDERRAVLATARPLVGSDDGMQPPTPESSLAMSNGFGFGSPESKYEPLALSELWSPEPKSEPRKMPVNPEVYNSNVLLKQSAHPVTVRPPVAVACPAPFLKRGVSDPSMPAGPPCAVAVPLDTDKNSSRGVPRRSVSPQHHCFGARAWSPPVALPRNPSATPPARATSPVMRLGSHTIGPPLSSRLGSPLPNETRSCARALPFDAASSCEASRPRLGNASVPAQAPETPGKLTNPSRLSVLAQNRLRWRMVWVLEQD